MGSQDKSGWEGAQEVCRPTFCSKRGQLSTQLYPVRSLHPKPEDTLLSNISPQKVLHSSLFSHHNWSLNSFELEAGEKPTSHSDLAAVVTVG